jgi:hypothetical protein
MINKSIINRINNLLIFHQGWTDIINSLALVNFYLKQFSEISVLIRDDAAALLKYYCRNSKGVDIIPLKIHDFSLANTEFVSFINNVRGERLYHGTWDKLRSDKFQGAYDRSDLFFVDKFYEAYGIDKDTRYQYFEFSEYPELENSREEAFLLNHGNNNYLAHYPAHDLNARNQIHSEFAEGVVPVNLDQTSQIFFDQYRILQRASKIVMIDSVYAALCNILDSKFRCFSHVPIVVKCLRGYNLMYAASSNLDNWIIK